jgi:hypothetical protein
VSHTVGADKHINPATIVGTLLSFLSHKR